MRKCRAGAHLYTMKAIMCSSRNASQIEHICSISAAIGIANTSGRHYDRLARSRRCWYKPCVVQIAISHSAQYRQIPKQRCSKSHPLRLRPSVGPQGCGWQCPQPVCFVECSCARPCKVSSCAVPPVSNAELARLTNESTSYTGSHQHAYQLSRR